MRARRRPDRATAPDPDARSGLVLLPAELRNHIYEFAFTLNDGNEAWPQHIFTVNPPSRALLATSRQIYDEAQGIYHEAWKQYWASHHFIINSEVVSRRDKERFSTLQKCGFLQPLQHLTITMCKTSNNSSALTFELENRRGGWKITETAQSVKLSPKYLVVQPHSFSPWGQPPLTWRPLDRAKMQWACDTFKFKRVESMERQILAVLQLLEDWDKRVEWN